MTKKKHRICMICHKEINSKDNYIKINEYNFGNEINTGFYHSNCFRERFMNFKKIQDEANKLFSMAKPLIEKASGELA